MSIIWSRATLQITKASTPHCYSWPSTVELATLSVQYMDTGCMRTNRSRYVLGDYFPVFQTVSHLRKPVPKLKIKAIKIDIKSS